MQQRIRMTTDPELKSVKEVLVEYIGWTTNIKQVSGTLKPYWIYTAMRSLQRMHGMA